MRNFSCLLLPALLAAAAPPAPDSRAAAPTFSAPGFSYADLADVGLNATIAAQVRVRSAAAVKDEQAAGLRPGMARLYVEADIVSLIRAPGALPPTVAYVVDLPRTAAGKAPKLRKGTEFLLLANPVAGRPGEIRLAAPDAQIPFSRAQADRMRAIFREVLAAEPPPRITGIGKAFHVPGSIPGESETQIFLQTAGGQPVSLNILRRPGETPRWAVALSEIVDEAAAPPARETLLWYRLACTLPRALPRQSVSDADAEGAAAIQSDYRFVTESLGPCLRTRANR
jgi:hypothetical protein